MTGSSGGGTTISKTEPPAYVQPYAVQHLGTAANLSQLPYQMYSGQFVRPTYAQLASTPQPQAATVTAPQQQIQLWPGGPFKTIKSAPLPTSAPAPTTQGMITGYENLPQSAVTDFLNARVQGFSPEQEQALTGTAARATAGSPVTAAAQQNILGTLRGDYLTGNPYLDQMVDQTQRDVMTRLGPAFVRSGSTGNTGLAQVTAQQLADASNALRYQNYDAERQRQMQANLFAPQLAASDYADLQALMGVGAQRQALGQTQKDLAYQEFLNQIGYPYQQADVLGNAINQATGGITTQQGPNSYNRAAGILGGALGGAGLGSALGAGTASGLGVGGAMGVGIPAMWPFILGGGLLGGTL